MKTFFEFLTKIVNLFPKDPLTKFINDLPVLNVLGYFNWFLPVSTIVDITNAWVISMLSARVAMFLYKVLIKKV